MHVFMGIHVRISVISRGGWCFVCQRLCLRASMCTCVLTCMCVSTFYCHASPHDYGMQRYNVVDTLEQAALSRKRHIVEQATKKDPKK